ncbi:MAG: nucleotide-sugar aminotransferase [Candidatus Peregrinibacteria bacterium Gr01-1014_25]|nr:MAG: nucleotide-sugar aminotransferase [Candidatus Peregrinibacteria bacterium Gr01-1014_25]
MRVPFSYLERQFADIDAYFEELRPLVQTGNFTLGKPVEQFEERFAALCKMPYAVGVGSGTDALMISLMMLGIQPDDEVITTANNFIAPAGAIACCRARPVFVDSDEAYMMDPTKLEAVITPRTRAIIAVHHNGNVCDMPAIMAVAEKHKLLVIEDACHAIGASLNGTPVGSWGSTACFSLHPLKNLNVWGDGGVIVTRSKELYEKMHLYRNHGLKTRDEVVLFGRNSRLHTVQAAIGNKLIREIDFITSRRIEIAGQYDVALSKLAPEISVPPRNPAVKHVFFQYIIRVRSRDALLKHLHDAGVEAKIHYPIPIHLQEGAKYLGYKPGDLPVTEEDSRHILSLPLHQHLTPEEVGYTIEQVRNFCRKQPAL